MPIITLPPLPSTGQQLLNTSAYSDPFDAYTESIHRPLDPASPTEGLMSTANGRLTTDNLKSTFVVSDYHIMPEQAVISRSGSMTSTSSIYASGVAHSVSAYEDNFEWFTLPGTSLRWYQAYAATFAIMQWSLFTSFNCWRGVYQDAESNFIRINTPIAIRCVLNGSAIDGTVRWLGQNMFHPVSPGHESVNDMVGPGLDSYDGEYASKSGAPPYPGGNPKYVFSEAHSAVHFDMHHGAALAKGYHEISVQCAMQAAPGAAVYVQSIGSERRSSQFRGRGYFNLTGKLSLGVRNARVLALL